MTAEYKSYAYLPEDLLNQMLENAPRIAKQLAANIELNDGQKNKAREIMEKERIIQICPDGDCTSSIMAADGANIIEHKTSADIILAIAVGVDDFLTAIPPHGLPMQDSINNGKMPYLIMLPIPDYHKELCF